MEREFGGGEDEGGLMESIFRPKLDIRDMRREYIKSTDPALVREFGFGVDNQGEGGGDNDEQESSREMGGLDPFDHVGEPLKRIRTLHLDLNGSHYKNSDQSKYDYVQNKLDIIIGKIYTQKKLLTEPIYKALLSFAGKSGIIDPKYIFVSKTPPVLAVGGLKYEKKYRELSDSKLEIEPVSQELQDEITKMNRLIAERNELFKFVRQYNSPYVETIADRERKQQDLKKTIQMQQQNKRVGPMPAEREVNVDQLKSQIAQKYKDIQAIEIKIRAMDQQKLSDSVLFSSQLAESSGLSQDFIDTLAIERSLETRLEWSDYVNVLDPQILSAFEEGLELLNTANNIVEVGQPHIGRNTINMDKAIKFHEIMIVKGAYVCFALNKLQTNKGILATKSNVSDTFMSKKLHHQHCILYFRQKKSYTL